VNFPGKALLAKSQAERLAADYDGRPADKGDMLEALKQAHPERWEKIKSLIAGEQGDVDGSDLDRPADRADRG
jgi:hypothetical protein